MPDFEFEPTYCVPRLPTVGVSHEEEALHLLSGVSDLLSNFQEFEVTISKVANLLVSSLANWCIIDLVTENKKVERVAVTHRDADKSDLAREIYKNHPASPTAQRGVYKVIETRKSILIPVVPDSAHQERADNDRHLELIRELGSSSYMCIPLIARGKVVGSIILMSGDRVYNHRDLKTAEDVASCIAIAVDNVFLFRKMQDAIVVRDEFLATLSHELRTPLNVIQGWIKVLQSEKLDEESYQNALTTLERNSDIQAHMINDLLDVSKIVSGKLSMQKEKLDLTETVQSSLESIRLGAKERGITIHQNMTPETVCIGGDASQIQRMLQNILSNSLKFTPAGGNIELNLAVHNESVMITIMDNGIGIDSSFIPHAFESFRQQDSSTTRCHEGLGLGLSITKHIVENHGGRISIKSRGKNTGTLVTILLPIMAQASTTLSSSPEETPDSCATLALEGLHALVVDDSEDIRFLIARYLQKSGAHVIEAESAAEALQQLKKHNPQILISDIGMPKEDGYSLISKVRNLPVQQGKNIPAIALTAYASENEKQKALEYGFDLHLSKPIFRNSLVSNINVLLKNRMMEARL